MKRIKKKIIQIRTLPDVSLKAELIGDYEFNKDKAEGFINDFRKTIKFANLTQEDLEEDAETETETEDKNTSKFKRKKTKMIDTQSFNIPLLKQNSATLAFDKLPITQGDLDRIKQWIDLIVAPLVEEEKENDSEDIT